MHPHHLQQWRHNHRFNDTSLRNEKNTRQVILLTVIMMTIIISIVTHDPKPLTYHKNLIAEIMDIQHVTIEVNQCEEH